MNRVIALGFFDGIHIGHAELLKKVKAVANEKGATPSVLSFDVHPDSVVFNVDVPLLGDTISRQEIIKRCFGIDDVIFIHFSKSVMEMEPGDFLDSIVDQLDVIHIVCGYDFTFGKYGAGNAAFLREYCIAHNLGVDIIPQVTLDGKVVSSTYIRELIENGDIETANRFLGHPHCLSDTVHSGYHVGRKMEAPTINMFFPPNVIVPKHGVYATRVILEDKSEHEAVTNIGVRPTFSDDNKVSVESHLLDFTGDLYGLPARVDFYSYLRPEIKFEDMDALSIQIRNDTEQTRKYFEKAEKA